ncbi:ribosome recycling factor [Mesotoga sp. Brook.08.YT.4.2.5.1]|uniref:ribosome recycling factor n=1 Tax=unclassified Mesotoga TaxID=1184398 RepID=UPI000C510B4D|nr:ribosome recycling factor [Mesotoga sp. Brook.08.YT.4.2.5.1]PNQ04970.1 ribosome recycling factor [Mesotoga sp. SC_NapDC3]PNS37970.1 ribosome recycling factor [Mesotoga sp. B105.6.4]PXF33956.1 ribosome recycling factor [Mesotoga sp. SC_NapDC]RDI91208.1 ribosome recycling factor [Mesotoga sp. Brook.08.YT.4.2.5.2.]RIZ60977.1 ribosome recycling factor [Mesotoga sp. SC_NapDC2]
MMNSLLKDAESRMKKSVEKIVEEYGQMRTGRPSPALLESVKVDYYGVLTPINQMATITVTEERSLIIKPWDKTVLSQIEKAIFASKLDLTPINDGANIKLNFPIPTTEQREKWVKLARDNSEKGKIAIRNIRRDAIKEARDLEKASEMTEDDLKKFEEDIQELTNKYIEEMDKAFEKKSKEIMEF